jgi:3-hydroxybutyryl-CoA dehydrogenase
LYRKTAFGLIVPIMKELSNPAEIHVGVVGLGLMGSSIVAALLIAGHPVIAIAPIPADAEQAAVKIAHQLDHCRQTGLVQHLPGFYFERLTISEDYNFLENCSVVIECVIEKVEIKTSVYKKITDVVNSSAIIGSNTSAIPISVLQQQVLYPERFLGIHWAEPAFMTRFLEITCGELTASENADRIFSLAHQWGKEPTLLKKDIRGFITNRLMYAVYREIFHLLESNQASQEDADKAFRYDAGSWMTLMGIFRRMDYMGLSDYATIVDNLFPVLSNTENVPAKMKEMVSIAAKGVHNGKGLYPYQNGEASQWDEAFASFNNEIRQLASEYSAAKVEKFLGH